MLCCECDMQRKISEGIFTCKVNGNRWAESKRLTRKCNLPNDYQDVEKMKSLLDKAMTFLDSINIDSAATHEKAAKTKLANEISVLLYGTK